MHEGDNWVNANIIFCVIESYVCGASGTNINYPNSMGRSCYDWQCKARRQRNIKVYWMKINISRGRKC